MVLLRHGFPASSFQYRELMPLLADNFHVIALDLPDFGYTEVPNGSDYHYTFEAIAKTMEAPTGFRLALAHPERVTAIITQNGNAYQEGLGTHGIRFVATGAIQVRRTAERCVRPHNWM